MIAKLSGLLDDFGPDWAVIDVSGVGYLVSCSAKTLVHLGVRGDACTGFTQLQVSETGKLLSSKVLSEDPSGLNFGAVELHALSNARFIPAFRNGKPCGCTFHMTRYVVIAHPSLGEDMLLDLRRLSLQAC